MVTTEGRKTEKMARSATCAELDAAKLGIFRAIREGMLSNGCDGDNDGCSRDLILRLTGCCTGALFQRAHGHYSPEITPLSGLSAFWNR